MNSPKKLLAVLLAVALSGFAAGCNQTISKKEKTTVSSDGTVKSKETTVSERPDGTLIKTEETKKTTRP